MYQCYQVRVQYIDQEYRNNTYVDEFQASDWKNLSRYDNLENEVKKMVHIWITVFDSRSFASFQTRTDTPLLVNIKGCGYPPETSCPVFANRFNEIYKSGKTFPCHYSRENPWIVLQYYNYEESIFSIAASILIPNVIFVVSLLILLYWYCPYCQAKCKKYEDQIDQEDAEDIGQEITKPTE